MDIFGDTTIIEIITPIAGILALTVAGISIYLVMKEDQGSQLVREIASAIRDGANTFLRRQYMTIWAVIIAVSFLLFMTPGWGWKASLVYIGGGLSSTIAGFLGMFIAVRANSRTANAARKGISKALKIAFRGGLVMGMSVVGIGILGVFLTYSWLGDPTLILPFSFGASSVALFARVGGGIFTKTADVGADLVGKIEKGIPEDDPRNPAVIADNVGDNVGDVAGMGADIFESYVASIVAAMIVGVSVYGTNGVLLPFLIASIGIVGSVISVGFVRVKKGKNPSYALNMATFVSMIITAAGSIPILAYVFGWGAGLILFIPILAGIVSGLVIGLTSDYFTNNIHTPTQNLAGEARYGPAIVILGGFSRGLISTFLPIISIAVAIIVSFASAGLYGITLAGVGMLSISGVIVASDAYGPVADNAGGIVEQSKMSGRVRRVTDQLDSVGNTTKAITKGFAIGSAALTAVALFAAYSQVANISKLDLLDPGVIGGVLLGGGVVATFTALTISSVGRNAHKMVAEVRRQFKEIPGLMKGKTKPDYARCVDIATKGALRELVVPGILALLSPIIIGFIMGKAALGGFLAGAIVSGLIFALFMANAGGAWDNAKKYIEMGHFGGKGSQTHTASVVGDTVGDPFKDTTGPSLNILIKLMSIVSLIIATLLIA